MKVNRNDPCPCGSGKKYKLCCLAVAASAAESPDQLAWQRLHRALEGYVPRMVRFVEETYGPEALHEAWADFLSSPGDEENFDPATPHMQLFMPWFFHCWAPDPFDTAVEDESLYEQTPTSTFLARRSRSIDPTLQRYLAACAATPISFYELASCNPGHGFVAHDILTGEEFAVLERSASRTMAVNDIIFAQIVRVDGIAILEACPPFGLAPLHRIAIIELRKKILHGGERVTTELLREWDIELRELYLAIAESMLNPVMPKLQNTDGDPLLPQRLIFDIDSADACFAALKSLAHAATDAELLESVKRDSAGVLTRVRFDWTKAGNRLHKSWSNTVLGSIEITRTRLHCDVNSSERAAELKRLIETRLGAAARYRLTKIESVESALARRAAKGGAADVPSSDLEELQRNPAVQEQLRQFTTAHYETWPSTPLPALKGKTPKQAMGSSEGREKVEALLRQFARDGARMRPPLDAMILLRLRERLGLPQSER
jgi:hypothetical protein